MGVLSSLLGIGQAQQTYPGATVTEPTIAKEISPYLQDILKKGQTLYKTRMEEGFQPYTGQTIAGLTPEQLQAREKVQATIGQQVPVIEESKGLVRGTTEKPTIDVLQDYMNPYQQAVTDIAKRQAEEQFEQSTLPMLRKQAIDTGAFGGSRAAMRESQAQDAQARLLADLQAKGDLAAFQNAQQQFAAQKAREAQAASGLTGLAQTGFGAGLQEASALQTIGEEDQRRQQMALDEQYKQFLQERQFPETELGKYQALVGQFPIPAGTITTAPPTPQPSSLEKLAAMGLSGANIYGRFGGFSEGGLGSGYFGKAQGGPVTGGLSSLPVIRRQNNNQVHPRFYRNWKDVYNVGNFLKDKFGRIVDKFGNLINPKEEVLSEEQLREAGAPVVGPNLPAINTEEQKLLDKHARRTKMQRNLKKQKDRGGILDIYAELANPYLNPYEVEVEDVEVKDVEVKENKKDTTTTDTTDLIDRIQTQIDGGGSLGAIDLTGIDMSKVKETDQAVLDQLTTMKGDQALIEEKQKELAKAREKRIENLIGTYKQDMISGGLTAASKALLGGEGFSGALVAVSEKLDTVESPQEKIAILEESGIQEDIQNITANSQQELQRLLAAGQITQNAFNRGMQMTQLNAQIEANILERQRLGISSQDALITTITDLMTSYSDKENELVYNLYKSLRPRVQDLNLRTHFDQLLERTFGIDIDGNIVNPSLSGKNNSATFPLKKR